MILNQKNFGFSLPLFFHTTREKKTQKKKWIFFESVWGFPQQRNENCNG